MWYSAVGSIVTLLLSLLAVPLAAAAQPPGKVYRIGFLSTNPPPAYLWEALLDGLRERGYSEGRNLVFERRFSEGNAERFPEFVAEMVQLKVDCIIVSTTPAALAAKNATQTIPIVIPTAIDPVGAGLVASLARPGGDLTGLSVLAPELSGKRLELLKEVVPGMTRVAVLWNAANPANTPVWQRRRRRPARWGSSSTHRRCGACRTSRARSPARLRCARMHSSSWWILSSVCTTNKSPSSPPSSTCRACLT
jgi:ABC-type uncharacterized transport system substrate-binding protein